MRYTYLSDGTKAVKPSEDSQLSPDFPFVPIVQRVQDNNYRFAGKEEYVFGNGDSGLLDFGARYYDPWSCQWTAVDPLAEKSSSQSSYNYCINSPLNYCDPYGRDTVYVLDQVNRPLDNGIVGTSYTGTVIVIQNGTVSGEYRGSSYPNSVSLTDNSPASNTISEGAHSYTNRYGHTPQSTCIPRKYRIPDGEYHCKILIS